ncbi:MAG: hypothetical protein ACI89X_003082 [Planctomycetota bacterium]|jgi:hypothetical protein
MRACAQSPDWPGWICCQWRLVANRSPSSSAAAASGETSCNWPDTDEIVLLDAMLDVYVLQEDRTFSRVIDNEQRPEQASPFDFTDIAGVGSNQFASAETGDGFLLDLNDRTVKQHFCYAPGFINPGGFTQHTDSVAFDPISGRIIVQPITWSEWNGSTMHAEVGTLPITGGEGDDWHPIDEREFLAVATACIPAALLIAESSDQGMETTRRGLRSWPILLELISAVVAFWLGLRQHCHRGPHAA